MTDTTDKPTDEPSEIAALIAEAEAALQGVTDGAWKASLAPWPPQIGCCPLVGNPRSASHNYCNVAAANTDADILFIAYARQGVPALIAALRQVMAERELQTERLRLMIERADAAEDKLDAIRAMKGTAQ